jgi:MFS family permease
LLLASLILYSFSFCLMPLMPGLVWLALPLLLFGFAQGFNIPLSALLLTAQAPPEQRAALVAVNAMFLRLAQTIAPMIFSILAAQTNAGVSIASATAVAVVMAALAIKM